MPRMEVTQVAKRSSAAWVVKDQWRDLRSSAYELALPMRNLYQNSGAKGQTKQRPGARKMNSVFDSTLMVMTVQLANRLQAELTPPFQRWVKLVPGAFIPEKNRSDVEKRLKFLNDMMFSVFQVSNFDTAINEFYLDLIVGTGIMMVMRGNDDMPVRYICVPQAQVALEEGPHGGINGVFRQHSMKIRIIEEYWEAFDVILPTGFDKMLAEDPEKEVNLIEATYFDAKADVWYYDVILQGADGKRKGKGAAHRLVEDEFAESPWIVTRWIKVAGEVEGRGPALFALPDAKTLNKLKELVLQNASIAVSGAWTAVNDGVLDPKKVKIIPGAVIPVGRNGGTLGASLAPLRTGADFNVADIIVDDLIQSIKKIMLDSSLGPEKATPNSATETIQRIKELQQDIGSPFGRLMTELIRPLVQKSLNVMADQGMIPLEPGTRIKVNGGTIDVQVQSPLAQAQNLADVQTAVQWTSLVQSLGQEAFMLGVKVEDIAEWMGRKMGVDPDLMRTPDERAQAQKMIGALAQQQAAGAMPAQQRTGTMSSNDNAGALPVAA